jgi:MoaA/NifB/PqqE/SkfB family radical SAM enzyme
MLSPEIWNTLKHAVDQNVSQSISIQYHTNCTIWNDRYIDLLQHFKSVNIGLSIDSNDPTQLEYIRHKSNYQEVISILKKYVDLKNKFNNINPFITVTVSIYNIYYLDKIIDGLKTFGLPVKLNFVHSPSHYDIRHLPVPIKKHLIEKFSNENKLNNVISLLEQTIPGCDIEWPKWRREVHMLDKIRNQSFQETFPDWYSIIKQFPN